jgi:hypothetical protein
LFYFVTKKKLMVNENPVQRPSAGTLLHHPCICPDANKSKAQLRKELNREKFKNEMLQRQVKRYEEQISKLDSPLTNPLLDSNVSLAGVIVNTSRYGANTMSLYAAQGDGKPSGATGKQFVRSLSSTFI